MCAIQYTYTIQYTVHKLSEKNLLHKTKHKNMTGFLHTVQSGVESNVRGCDELANYYIFYSALSCNLGKNKTRQISKVRY